MDKKYTLTTSLGDATTTLMGEDLLVDYANKPRKGPRPEEPLYDDDPVYGALREAFPTVHFHSKKRAVDVVVKNETPKKRVAIAKKRNSGKGTKSNGVKRVVRRVPRRRPDVYDFTCKEKLHRHEHNWRIFGRKPNKDRKGVERIYYKCTREKCRARVKIDLDKSRGREIHFEMYTQVR